MDVRNNLLANAGRGQQPRLRSRASLPCISRPTGHAIHGCTEQPVGKRWARSATPFALPCFTAMHFKTHWTRHFWAYRATCWRLLGTFSNSVCTPVLHCHAFQEPSDAPLMDVRSNVLAYAGHVQQPRLRSRASLPCISRPIGHATYGCTEQRVRACWARSATPFALPCFTAMHFKSHRTRHSWIYGATCWQTLGTFSNPACAPVLHCHAFQDPSDTSPMDV